MWWLCGDDVLKTLDALEKFLRGKVVAKNSKAMYRRAFALLNEFSEELPTDHVTLNEWLVWLHESYPELRDVSRAGYLRFVKTVYSYLTRAYQWDRNPTDLVERVRVASRKRRIFSTEELYMILQSCRTDYEKVLVCVLLDSACRIHELSGLRVEDVFSDSFKCSADTKTGEHIYRCRPELCEAMRKMAVNGYIFTRQNGLPVNAKVLTNKVGNMVRRAGVRGNKLGAHTFRHTAATLVAEESGSVLAVQSITCHKSVDMAMLYIHDVNAKLAQKYSPFEIASQKMMSIYEEKSFQLSLTVPEVKRDDVIVSGNGQLVYQKENDWLESMFRKVPQDVQVRPLLKEADLDLIRYAFKTVVEYGSWVGSDVKVRDLWQRILRKV